ncbi:MAG: HisS family protein [Candidatus Babeliales bacterium]|jgi:histidyl-tRNA synthetase
MHHSNYGIPQGTSEFFGMQFIQRKMVLDIIETIYKEYGFDPLSTPVLEHAKVFSGHHGEGESLLFHLKDCTSQEMVLRYDLTVPMARYIADHPEAPIPFKRYQIATVFRDDEIDKGHFREFTQCDGDVIGVGDRSADAEVIHMACEGLSRLGFPNFVININHRLIIKALAEKSELAGTQGRLHLQRAMDEVSKFSEKWVHHNNPDYHSSFIAHIREILARRALPDKAVQAIIFVCTLEGDTNHKFEVMKKFLGDFSEGVNGIEELEEICSYLDTDIKKRINFDLLLARGADYYTGFILEGSIPNIPVGAVLGGGRYDHLVKNLGGPDLPAVGMAFGLERILTALLELKLIQEYDHTVRILVVPTAKQQHQPLLELTRKLRKKGLAADFIPMNSCSEIAIKEYAQKRNFSLLATYGQHGILLHAIKNNDIVGATSSLCSLLA